MLNANVQHVSLTVRAELEISEMKFTKQTSTILLFSVRHLECFLGSESHISLTAGSVEVHNGRISEMEKENDKSSSTFPLL